jgi:hypothetical protein
MKPIAEGEVPDADPRRDRRQAPRRIAIGDASFDKTAARFDEMPDTSGASPSRPQSS